MFLSRGDRDLGLAFQTHPGRVIGEVGCRAKVRSAAPVSDALSLD